MIGLTLKVSLLVPSRKRPEMLRRMYESAMATAQNPNDVEVITYIDDDDETYDDFEAGNLIKIRGERIILSQMWNKCHEVANGDYFGHMGDDVVFRTRAWDAMIVGAFPRDNIAFVHGRDGSGQDAGRGFGTHGFLHREWTRAVGYFVPPYFSCDYNDTWLNDVSNAIGRRIFIKRVLIEHMHPVWRKRDYDQTDNERLARGARDNVAELYDSKSSERRADAEKLRALIS